MSNRPIPSMIAAGERDYAALASSFQSFGPASDIVVTGAYGATEAEALATAVAGCAERLMRKKGNAHCYEQGVSTPGEPCLAISWVAEGTYYYYFRNGVRERQHDSAHAEIGRGKSIAEAEQNSLSKCRSFAPKAGIPSSGQRILEECRILRSICAVKGN